MISYLQFICVTFRLPHILYSDDLKRANPTQPEVAVNLSNPNNLTRFQTDSDNNVAVAIVE